MILKAPFPYFGGKSRCAHIVWQRFGNAPNYVEPFLGSAAVPLNRPHPARTETFNDKNCYIANFFRAVQHAPEEVALYADGPVNEADLHARHRWLVEQVMKHGFREKMMSDPHFFDAKIAGWWVWGISQWIGSGWCSRPEWVGRTLPGRAPRGIHSDGWKVRPNLTRVRNISISNHWEKRPSLGRGARGVHALTYLDRRTPDLHGNSGATGKGIHASGFQKKLPTMKRALPQLSGDGSGNGRGVLSANIRANLIDFMFALRDRLRCARICCGDWKRILGPSPTTCIGLTAVFLDPPYSRDADRDPSIYSDEDLDVAHEVAKWARENGDNPKLRIALCGYDGEHRLPKRWACVTWKANGGYGNQAKGKGRDNARRERIWFSPHCLKPSDQLALGPT